MTISLFFKIIINLIFIEILIVTLLVYFNDFLSELIFITFKNFYTNFILKDREGWSIKKKSSFNTDNICKFLRIIHLRKQNVQ